MNKLSVLESHIYVKQGLQRQGAHKKDKQYDQAVDIALNKAQNRIIKDRLFPNSNTPYKFEINQKYASDIQVLIVTDKELDVFKNGVKSYGELPYDFAYLLSDSSFVVEDCDTEAFADSSETDTERVKIIPFETAKTVAPYYQTVITSVDTNVATSTFTGYQTKEEKVYLVDEIIRSFKNQGQNVYWEQYKDIYRKESFLLVTKDLALSIGLSVDGSSIVIVNQDSVVTVFKDSTGEGTEKVNRDTKADFLMSALNSNYHKSAPDSPLSILTNNKLIVYGSERFLVNKILINYIRKPKRISLSLNQGSELSASVHEEICDLAIQIIKKQIEAESYQLEVQDNKGRID